MTAKVTSSAPVSRGCRLGLRAATGPGPDTASADRRFLHTVWSRGCLCRSSHNDHGHPRLNAAGTPWHKSSGSRAWGTCRPGLGAGREGRSAVAAGRAAWGWHGAVSDIFRPARLACHRLDRRGGIAFRGGADRGDLVARLLPDRCGRAFGRFVYGVDLRPRPLRYAGRLAISQVKDPPRLPERVRVPESPRLLWVSGLL
jgi:hypothetical protein